VGVFVDESPETVLRIAGQVGLDIAQLHGSESPQQYPRGMRVWKAIRMVGQDFSLPTAGPAEAVLVDGPASGRIFDWTRLRRPGRPPQAEGLPHVILAGGLDAGNVREAIEQVHPWGVDACSQLESSPGRKDRFKMAAFLKAALAASP
jgi:phosphoribosylanthranilate isomerase